MKLGEELLSRYVGRIFVVRFLALLAFFVIILQMLDLLNQSDRILDAVGAGMHSILRYISLRAPQIVSQFTPFAALLAIVATLAQLSHSSEIAVMRAAGMSIQAILRPLGAACLVIAALHFFFHETFVVSNARKLAYWEANDYAADLPPDSGVRTDVRLTFGSEIIHAGSAARLGEQIRLNNVVIYRLGADGLAAAVTEARAAVFAQGAWRLIDAAALDGDTLRVDRTATRPWNTTLDPELLFALALNPEHTPLPQLAAQIRQLSREGADIFSALTAMISRFSRPLATLVMPLLGAVAGFGVGRQGAQLLRASVGASLGFGYFVIENMMLAIGKLGAVPAFLAAFFPLILFLVVGYSLVLLMEN